MAFQADVRVHVAITVDVDPDANRPAPGRPDAISARAEKALHEACFRGLDVLLTALENRCLPATFFWEGRTLEVMRDTDPGLLDRSIAAALCEHGCHGMHHEDFAGTMSGLPLDEEQTRDALTGAGHAVEAAFGLKPLGFRAPYCRLTPELRTVLSQLGYVYDASLTNDIAAGEGLDVVWLDGAPGVAELPMPRSRDADGRPISAYLWQLFEGRREGTQYARIVGELGAKLPGSLVQLALHPWHIFVGADGLPVEDGTARLLDLLDLLQDMDGLAFTTNLDYLHERRPA